MVDFKTLIRVLACGFLSAFVALIVILKIVQPIVAKDAVETQSKLKTEYTWYYNGEEVDSDKIDLSLYDYTVNDEKRIVYITEKQYFLFVIGNISTSMKQANEERLKNELS